MARTKEFDVDLALERTMQVFWAKGFEATSAQDLVDALGINRSSLYATFGSKAELYRRALALYAERPECPRRARAGARGGRRGRGARAGGCRGRACAATCARLSGPTSIGTVLALSMPGMWRPSAA